VGFEVERVWMAASTRRRRQSGLDAAPGDSPRSGLCQGNRHEVEHGCLVREATAEVTARSRQYPFHHVKAQCDKKASKA
jgi:hypothetical protein